MRENLEDLGFGDKFLDIASKAQTVKERVDKPEPSKIKSYLRKNFVLMRLKARGGEGNI